MKLRQQVVDINSRIQSAASQICTANLEFQSVMKQRRNVNLTIEHLESGNVFDFSEKNIIYLVLLLIL